VIEAPPSRDWMRSCASAVTPVRARVVALHLHGELADHASSVVLPFLLPDTPVVAWWPSGGRTFRRGTHWASWHFAG